jgi:three-Cys-motif partner protein
MGGGLLGQREQRKSVYVIESDKNNCNNLSRAITRHKLLIEPKVINTEFETIIKSPSAVKCYQQRPSFFFIDPFGYSLDFEVLEKMMSYPKNELLINFMFKCSMKLILNVQ